MQATPDSFWQWVGTRHTDEFALFVIPIFFIVLAVVVTTGMVLNSIHRRRAEINLKRELLDRGMSAEEIATIVAATSARGRVDLATPQLREGSKP